MSFLFSGPCLGNYPLTRGTRRFEDDDEEGDDDEYDEEEDEGEEEDAEENGVEGEQAMPYSSALYRPATAPRHPEAVLIPNSCVPIPVARLALASQCGAQAYRSLVTNANPGIEKAPPMKKRKTASAPDAPVKNGVSLEGDEDDEEEEEEEEENDLDGEEDEDDEVEENGVEHGEPIEAPTKGPLKAGAPPIPTPKVAEVAAAGDAED
jgi:hypothetical protein